MRSTTHSLSAQTRTSKQLALPSITCKPIRICKSLVVEHDTARTKKVAEKPVTMFIEAKAVEATPLAIAAPSCSPDLPASPQPSKPEVSELTQAMALVAELTALAGRLNSLTVFPATGSANTRRAKRIKKSKLFPWLIESGSRSSRLLPCIPSQNRRSGTWHTSRTNT